MAGPNLYWIDRNGDYLDAGWDHMNAVLEEPGRFYTEGQIEEIKNDPTFDMIRKRENPYLWKNGVVRVRSFGTDVYIQATNRAIRKYLDKLIVDNKNAEYNVSVMDPETGEIENQFAGMSLSEFMKKFSGRSRGGYSSKVSRFREIVRKEVKNVLSEIEYGSTGAYWIGPNGRVESAENHYQVLRNDPDWFNLSEEIRSEMEGEPNWRIKLVLEDTGVIYDIYKRGFVRIRKHGDTIYIQGTKKSIRQNVDKILSDNSNTTYRIDVMSEDGFEYGYDDLSTKEFIEKFSGRDKSSGFSSKITRFR